MPSRTMFVFDGNRFALQFCSINASLPDPYWCDKYNKGKGKYLRWSIEFRANGRKIDEEYLAPSVDIDGLPIHPSNWIQLSGTSAKWSQPIDPKTGERYGMTYLYDHNLITQGIVEIGPRRLNRFRVTLTGKNEVGQSFELCASVPFEGVTVNASERDSSNVIKARLSEALDISNLSPSRFALIGHKYNSRVEMATMSFRPKT